SGLKTEESATNLGIELQADGTVHGNGTVTREKYKDWSDSVKKEIALWQATADTRPLTKPELRCVYSHWSRVITPRGPWMKSILKIRQFHLISDASRIGRW